MHNGNGTGYLRLAMLRNEKLYTMRFPEEADTRITASSERYKNATVQTETGVTISVEKILKKVEEREEQEKRFSWMQENKDLVRIEQSILWGLDRLKEDGRASLFKDVSQAQLSAEYQICKLNMQKNRTNADMKMLSDSTKIKDAADYLELLLQIHFPQEFPNPLVEEVLSIIGTPPSPVGHHNEELKPVFTETVSQILNQQQGQNDPLGALEEEIGLSAGTGEQVETSDPVAVENYESGTSSILDGLQPSLLEKYQEAKLSLNLQETQGIAENAFSPVPVLDDGIAQ